MNKRRRFKAKTKRYIRKLKADARSRQIQRLRPVLLAPITIDFSPEAVANINRAYVALPNAITWGDNA